MRDNRFIELVNLYVDRQISAEETAELEAELQANPRRRAVYHQYCQLHTASKQVYAGFRTSDSAAASATPGRVVQGNFARRSRSNWIHYAGGLTAAACLAIAFVRYNAEPAAPAEVVAQSAPVPSAQVAVVPPPAIVAPTPEVMNVKASRPISPASDYSEMLKALRQEEQRAIASGQIQLARLPSLFDDGVFDQRPVFTINNQREFRGKQSPKAEFTAIEFQR